MNRQSSEGRQSASTRSPAEQPRHTETGKTFSHRSTEVDKTAVLKKQPPIPRKPARNAPVKVFTREAGPGQSIVQRTDPGNEREITMNKMKSPKHMRVVASLLNMSDQQSGEGDGIKPGTAAEREESRGSQSRQSGTFNRRVEIYSRSKNGTPNSYTPINVDKNKTEISDAIFERDEVDEEDHKDPHQPNQNVSSEEKRASSTDQAILAQQEYFNHEPLMMKRGVSDSPGLKKELMGYNGIYKFPENLVDLSLSAMNKSNDGSLPGSRQAANVRGAFMNEHITLTELEKQKEKQRKMREALDSQLNEKKQKQQEEKMKQDELNKREEMRIKREMEQLKTLHEKESAYENMRKGHTKTEENEFALHNRSIVKPASAMQIEVHEKNYTENDVLNISNNNANLSFQPSSEKMIITPVRVRGKTESKTSNKDIFEPKSHGSPAKINSDVNTLVDENKKLRDENTKKEELIDALIMALKHKEGSVAAAAQNLQDKTNLYTTPKKETVTPPPVITTKPTKPANSAEVESDFYGYYLNGYMQPKQKFQASSEQPSAAGHTRFEAKDLSYSITEEKNFSINNYDKIDMKDYKPKIVRKAIPDYMMESNGVPSHSNTPYYRLAMGNNHSLSGLFGNTRGYSSPLAGNLNKSVFTPSHKLMDAKNSAYMPLISPNAGNMSVSLEPMKSVSQGNLIPKSHITPPEMLMNPSGSSLFRMKKRQDHSIDVMESTPHDLALDRKQPSERPAINIIDEEGSYAVTKPNPMPRREYTDLIHPYSSPSYGMHDYKKLEIIDTSNYHEKPAIKAHSMSVNPSPHDTPTEMGNSYQLKLFGKIALYGGGGAFDKRVMSEDMGKEKWALSEANLIRKTRKEEMFEKSKGLPSLESKSKFPKEVFPSNLKKKICH